MAGSGHPIFSLTCEGKINAGLQGKGVRRAMVFEGEKGRIADMHNYVSFFFFFFFSFLRGYFFFLAGLSFFFPGFSAERCGP
jgi:hypothetical protein